MQSLKNSMPSKKSIFVSATSQIHLARNSKSLEDHHETAKTSEFCSSSHKNLPLADHAFNNQSTPESKSSIQQTDIDSGPASISPITNYDEPGSCSSKSQLDDSQPRSLTYQHYLSNWGLPRGLVRWYKKKGIELLFDWQVKT